ncbi:MAG: Mur ligase family protein, partial [Thermoguttaceae bacterium]
MYSQGLSLIGITGTYGKTATSYLVAGMLAESGKPVGLIGSLGIYDGEKMFPTNRTTPPPDEIAFWLNRISANGCSHAILEISSVGIAQSHLNGLEFDAICLTNIKRNHLDLHKSVETYRRTKLDVFRHLKKNGIAICNADDKTTSAILPLIDHPTLTVGIRNECDIFGVCVERNIGEQTFLINAGTEAVPIRT